MLHMIFYQITNCLNYGVFPKQLFWLLCSGWVQGWAMHVSDRVYWRPNFRLYESPSCALSIQNRILRHDPQNWIRKVRFYFYDPMLSSGMLAKRQVCKRPACSHGGSLRWKTRRLQHLTQRSNTTISTNSCTKNETLPPHSALERPKSQSKGNSKRKKQTTEWGAFEVLWL